MFQPCFSNNRICFLYTILKWTCLCHSWWWVTLKVSESVHIMTSQICLVPESPADFIIWARVKGTCSPLGGILGILGDLEAGNITLFIHEGLKDSCLLFPHSHLLHHCSNNVIYIIQTTREWLWAPNHLLAFIS